MGTCMSTPSLQARFDEVRLERDELRNQLCRIHWCALEESRFISDYTAEYAKKRWEVLDSDLQKVEPMKKRTSAGETLYSASDLRQLQNDIMDERCRQAVQEADRYGVPFPGSFCSEMHRWSSDCKLRANGADDARGLRRAALRGVRSYHLYMRSDRRGSFMYTFGVTLDDPTARWPSVWPWRRDAVLSPDWQWREDQHLYWFGPEFHEEARAFVTACRDPRMKNAIPNVLTCLAKMHALEG